MTVLIVSQILSWIVILGLGLALSRQTVLDHGGDLWIGDENEAGAHFRLKLPC